LDAKLPLIFLGNLWFLNLVPLAINLSIAVILTIRRNFHFSCHLRTPLAT
jgi:hypothetical protein